MRQSPKPCQWPGPRSAISGERMEKIHWGPNWEEILGTEFAKRSKDYNFENVQKEIYGEFENTFSVFAVSVRTLPESGLCRLLSQWGDLQA